MVTVTSISLLSKTDNNHRPWFIKVIEWLSGVKYEPRYIVVLSIILQGKPTISVNDIIILSPTHRFKVNAWLFKGDCTSVDGVSTSLLLQKEIDYLLEIGSHPTIAAIDSDFKVIDL